MHPETILEPVILEVAQLFTQLKRVHTLKEKQALLESFSQIQKPTIISFLNAHAVNLAWKNRAFRQNLLHSDLLLRDGKGIEIALNQWGIEPGFNLNGTDFIPEILALFRAFPIALFGTREPFLTQAAQVIEKRNGCKVIAQLDGFQEEDLYLKALKDKKPRLIILAMGMPKQEAVATCLRNSLNYPCLIVNGGAVLDYTCERVPRAPLWVREAKMEWLFRLLAEPTRLFSRYVIGNPLFLWRIRHLKNSLPPKEVSSL